MKFSSYNIIKEHGKYKVLYNSYTKSSLFFDEKYDLSFVDDNKKIDKIDEDVKNELIKEGFIIENDRDEFEELKYAFVKKYFDKSVLTIALIPTLECNFACPYCCEKPFTCGKEDISNYFSILKKFSKNRFSSFKHVRINLFGGEPLIYYEHAKKYLEWLDKFSKDNNFEYSVAIITNGSLITEDKIDFLLKHNLYLIQITLDSDKENHDKMRIFKNGKPSFDILVKNIELVSKKINNLNKLFVLRINLNNTSVEKVRKSLETIDVNLRKNISLMYRVIYNTATYKEDNTNNINELEKYIKMGKKLGFNIYHESFVLQSCEAATDNRTFYLLPDLTLSKCANEIGHESCSFGYINENGDPILNPKKMINWFDANYSVFEEEKCKKCKMFPDCLGGCPLYKIKNKKRSCRSFDMVSLPNYYGDLDE